MSKKISAPAVDKLEDIKKIIFTLEYVIIPYSYIDTSNQNMKNLKKLKPLVYEQIQQWKTKNNFSLAKGYQQPLISLLSALGIVKVIKLKKSELNRPLGIDGPILSTFIKSRLPKAVQLTSIGHTLCDLAKKTDQNSIRKYDEILFWLFSMN